MSILEQQISMSHSVVNGRTIVGQKGDDWVNKNVAISQLRGSETESDLTSGYFPGGAGRDPYMYPDNRSVMLGENVVSSIGGIEAIKDSRTAAKIG